ncbi:MAG: nicotinate-nucleotide--dimethylbenzimidazole phosphoribosyltransferase [Lachnospiraceae bacterium]|nr:nicotinate-nucleotide--dimethylbenzimidazole phosphoribosyltransferase [Lachnospiraceae bacterium]MCM1279468.1 nicotinate-nucleotide--dimethylbenzimidazole phosphoribosyltransferase [Robinsoniella sp.]
MSIFQDYNKKIKEPNKRAMEQAKAHWDSIAKPLEGLGRLEDILIRIAGMTKTADVSIEKRGLIAMCADNGIVEEGVTQTDKSVTAIVAANMAAGLASVNRMCQIARVDVMAVDIGIDKDTKDTGLLQKKAAYGTKNFLKEPAMTKEEAKQAILTGMELVKECQEKGYEILATGEMGIGNTTTSSALASVLLDLPPELVTGKGAGLSRSGIEKKVSVIKEGISKYQLKAEEPFEALRCVGGLDIAGLTGVFLGGALYGIPIVIDGVISAVAALTAVRLCPKVKGYLIASHQGKEPASRAVMEALGLSPIIHGNLALGEGTGAALLFPMLDMALSVYKENATFEQVQIEAYQHFQ